MLIAFCSLIFWVMNNSHSVLDQRITTIESSLKADIADNKILIQENKVLIQKVLDNQNR